MSEQSNPIAEEQENQESEVAQTQATPAAEQPAAATTQKTPSVSLKDRDFESSNEDEDDYDEEDELEEDEEEDLHVEGPAEYVQRERSGRGRRIGSDVRPDDVDYKNIPVLSAFWIDGVASFRVVEHALRQRCNAASLLQSSALVICALAIHGRANPDRAEAQVIYGQAKKAYRRTSRN